MEKVLVENVIEKLLDEVKEEKHVCEIAGDCLELLQKTDKTELGFYGVQVTVTNQKRVSVTYKGALKYELPYNSALDILAEQYKKACVLYKSYGSLYTDEYIDALALICKSDTKILQNILKLLIENS